MEKPELLNISQENLPKHIAFILDGNGRWAIKHGFIRTIGHEKGVKTLKNITKLVKELGIPFMSVYVDETFDERLKNEPVRRLFVEKDPEKIAQIPEVSLLGQYPMKTYDFTIFESDDKYRGIKRMVELLGGDEKDIVVFGDGINDVKMMKEAAFGIAMGNACDELKEIADYVTADSTDDGVLKALEHFGWL